MQQFRNVQKDNEPPLQFTDAGDVPGLAFRKDPPRRLDLGGRNLEHFRSGVYDEADQLIVQFDDENAVFLIGMNFGLPEALAKVHHGNNFPAQIDHALNQIGSAGNRGNLRDTDDFAHGSDMNAVRFISDAEADDLKILFHREVPGPLGARHIGVFGFCRPVRLRTAALAKGIRATGALLGSAVEDKAVHAVEQVARKFEHLLGGGGKLGGTGSGLLHQFAHLVHGADNSLGAGSLFLNGRINFLGNFGEAAGGFGDLP